MERLAFQVRVVTVLQKLAPEFRGDSSCLDGEAWMRLILGDHSMITTTLLGCDSDREIEKSISNSIYSLSLRYLECIDDIRDKKLESMNGQ